MLFVLFVCGTFLDIITFSMNNQLHRVINILNDIPISYDQWSVVAQWLSALSFVTGPRV